MKKYKGITSYYKGSIYGEIIEAETESQLFRLASRIANKVSKPMDILYIEYISVDMEGIESSPLPQQYYVRLSSRKWEYKGNVPQDKIVNIA